MRTVSLEFLRHGPSHNQLLSPLTQYLALCENHATSTIHVSFEHNQFLHRMRFLSYQSSDDQARHFQITDTAVAIRDILSQIPALVAELSRDDPNANDLIHLRLVISSSELALLPFELAISPAGFPGAGQHVLLQTQAPITITREIRRVREKNISWQAVPRILFITASPDGYPPVPVEAHALALRQAIDPWLGYFKDGEERRQQIEKQLKVLLNANISQIAQECASGEYSHIHILAHGQADDDGLDRRHGIVLHNPSDSKRAEIVDGKRLAVAIRSPKSSANFDLSRAYAVTLASCDSGNVGSVAGAGASIAHALHEAGIPIVIGSQFPLSYEGSIHFVQHMYNGLLWGIDPRQLTSDLRRHLYATIKDRHDWASIVTYAALPDNFESDLAAIRERQGIRSGRAAVQHCMSIAAQLLDTTLPKSDLGILKDQARAATEKLRNAKYVLSEFQMGAPFSGIGSAALDARLASLEHHEIEALFILDYVELRENTKQFEPATELAREKLIALANRFLRIFKYDPSNSWCLVRYLCLALIASSEKTRENRHWKSHWRSRFTLAKSLLDIQARSERNEIIPWLIAAKVQLLLIAKLFPRLKIFNALTFDTENIVREISRLTATASPGPAMNAILTDVNRYLYFYIHCADDEIRQAINDADYFYEESEIKRWQAQV